MMAEEGHELEGKAPCAQHRALKIRRSKFWIRKFCSEKIEEMKQRAARKSARNNYPREVEHHSAVDFEEEHADEEPW
jgi:hypothetical protein